MKLWLISDNFKEFTNASSYYLLVANTWQNLVEKLSNLFGKAVEINTKTHEFSINHEIVGTFKRITDGELEDILWNGVELVYPELGTKC